MNTLNSLQRELNIEIYQAKNGDITSSKFLLGKAAELLNENKKLPPCLLEWLTDGLFVIANTEGLKVDANKAFNLNPRLGRKHSKSEDEQRMIARDIHDSGLGLHKADSAHKGKEGAYTKAARDYDISETNAEKIYQKYKEGFLIDDELKSQE